MPVYYAQRLMAYDVVWMLLGRQESGLHTLCKSWCYLGNLSNGGRMCRRPCARKIFQHVLVGSAAGAPLLQCLRSGRRGCGDHTGQALIVQPRCLSERVCGTSLWGPRRHERAYDA